MYIIDRFEGNYCICETEDKQMIQIERSLLPKEAKEGDCINESSHGYRIDEKETEKRKERVKSLMSQLFE